MKIESPLLLEFEINSTVLVSHIEGAVREKPFWVNETLTMAQSSDPLANQTDYPISLT